ncbi:ferric reductase-like transmembrane domain-containing protein [Niveibacterium terrae]|uniref:ferredoxin reductase family protein n=1 Tax=Niveibacterium terrae TaxID=3373598 RepID=UPI003A95197D
MKRALILFSALLVAGFVLTPGWTSLADGADFWAWRRQAVVLTGYVGFLAMAFAIVLATRPVRLEPWLGGLDKAYGLHKWLGIIAGISLSLHWLAIQSPHWLTEAGWLMPRARHGHGPHGGFGLMGLARELGEWAFYLLLILGAIALIKRIPYRFFHLVHKALAVVFVAGAFHAVMLMPDSWYAGPAGWLVIAVAMAGCAAAYVSLSGRIGATRRLTGKVESAELGAGGLIDLRLALPEPGLPHKAGQFAFLCFDGQEGAHPFTIASAGDPRHPRFAIKPLGDYTRTLPQRLAAGQTVEVEGPYGCFDFASDGAREIWVAGGIGITPFLARLDALGNEGGGRRIIDFWYCTKNAAEGAFPVDLESRCARAGVRLHRVIAERDGHLSAKKLADEIDELGASRVWFCGPAAFADSLRSGLIAAGLRREAFHCENFAFR